MAEIAVDDRRLLKTMNWWDGFVVGLCNPGFLLAGLAGSVVTLGPKMGGHHLVFFLDRGRTAGVYLRRARDDVSR